MHKEVFDVQMFFSRSARVWWPRGAIVKFENKN